MDLNHKTFGAGPPLVILHGLFGTLDNWATLARRWAADYTVILVDQRNHGRSPHAEEMDYPALAADLAQFLENQWVHECFLLGHSMGGKVAMQVALTYPDLVDRLVVVDKAPRGYSRGHDGIFTALRSLDPATATDRRHADDLLRTGGVAEAGVRQFLLKNLGRRPDNSFFWRMNLEVLHREYDRLLAEVGREAEPFAKPALFVRGERSDYVRDADWPEIQAKFPAARLATVPGAGHWVHAEAPAALFRLVSDFLGA